MFYRAKKKTSDEVAAPKVTNDEVQRAAEKLGVVVMREAPSWRWLIKHADGRKEILGANNVMALDALSKMVPAPIPEKSKKPLKLWTGDSLGVLTEGVAQARGLPSATAVAVFGCAHSRAELLRMVAAFQDRKKALVTNYHVKKYWQADAWGPAMAGVTPAAGLWVQFADKPKAVRVW